MNGSALLGFVAGVFLQGPVSEEAVAPTSSWVDMVSSLKAGLQAEYSKAIVLLVLIVGVVGFALVIAGRRRALEIEKAAGQICKISEEGQLLSSQIAEVRDALPNRPALRQQWAEFEESVIHVEGKVFNTLPAQEFLQDDAILQDITALRIRYPVLTTLPGIATGLGLLGTFLGIAVGLGKLVPVAHDAAQITKALPVVLGNLSSAFWTSIFGVIIALALTFWGSNSHERIHGSIDELHEAIDRRIPRITPERLLVRLLETSERQPEILESIRRESEEGRSYLQSIANDMAEKMGNHFRGAMHEVLNPHLQAMSEAVTGQVTRAGATSTEQARRFTDQMVKEVSGVLGQSIATMTTQLGDSGRQMQDVGRALEAVVALANNAVQTQQHAVQESGRAAVTAHTQSREAAGQLAEMQKAMAHLVEVTASMQKAQADTAGLLNRQQSLATETQARVEDFSKALGAGSQRYSENAGQLGDAASALADQIGLLTQRIGVLGTQSLQAGLALEKSVQGLNSRLETETQLVSQYGTAARALDQALKAADPLTSRMAITAQALERASRATEGEQARIAALLAQMHQAQQNAAALTEQLSQGFTGVEQTLRASSAHMASVVSGTEEWATEATNAVRQFGAGLKTSVEDSLSRYDHSLATAVRSLQASMKELEDLAEEIAARQSSVTHGAPRS